MTNEQKIAVREEGGLTQEGLDHTRDQLLLLENFVKEVLRKDEDYGVIPGTNGKPTLLKPGAANVTAAFNCHAEPAIDSAELDRDQGFVSYEAHVDLVSNKSGLVMARGFGSCNSHEVKYRYRWQGRGEDRVRVVNEDPLEQANTIKKMAIKRAEVDAAMRLPGVARFFTQDLEDMEAGGIAPEKATSNVKDNRYACSEHHGQTWTKRTNKEGKVWYSHKQGDGWCNMKEARLDAKDNRDQPAEPLFPPQAADATPEPARHAGKDITAQEWQSLYNWAAEKYGIEKPEDVHMILGKSSAEWTGTLRDAAALVVAAQEQAAKVR